MLQKRNMTGLFNKNQSLHHGANKIQNNLEEQKKNQELLKNAIVDESILRQVDKTFILCIDPETRLPFMINMGLKTADTIDLDNRTSAQKQSDKLQMRNDSDVLSEFDHDANSEVSEEYSAILDAKNYPFYYKIKRNLYIIEQLLNDENNLQFLGAKEADDFVANKQGSSKKKQQSNFAFSPIMKWSFKNNPNAEAFRR
jgi:hypothetical protein